MRSAPQSRLFAYISLINVIVSEESLCLLRDAFDLCFQNMQKSSRYQRKSVSGWTRKSASFQVRTILAKSTTSSRDIVDCTRLSGSPSRKPAPSWASYRFHQRMSQVASTPLLLNCQITVKAMLCFPLIFLIRAGEVSPTRMLPLEPSVTGMANTHR
jgi:hypothetical protein